MFTQEDSALINNWLSSNPNSSDQPEGGEGGGFSFGRVGQQLGNLPSNVVQSLADTGTALANLGSGPSQSFENLNVFKPFDIPEAQGMGQTVTDVALGKLAPELLASLIPFGAASKVGKLAGLGELGSEVLGNAAAGAFTGIKSGPEEALRQGAVNAALAGFGPLGGVKKLLPTLGLAGGDAAYEYAQTGDLGQAAQTAALDTAFSYMPNVVRKVFGAKETSIQEAKPFFGMNRALDYQAPQGEIPRLDYPEHAANINFENLGAAPDPDIIEGTFRQIGEYDIPELPWGPEAQVSQLKNRFSDLIGIKSPLLQDEPGALSPQIIIPNASPEPNLDDFFRLKNPIIEPEQYGNKIRPEPVRDIVTGEVAQATPEVEKIAEVGTPAPEPETKNVVQDINAPKFKINTKFGTQPVELLGEEDGVAHIKINDPVMGERFQFVNKSELIPETKVPITPKAGVPFQDIKLPSDHTPIMEEVPGTEANAGGLSDFAKREEQQAKRGKGMAKKIRPGEYGFISNHAAMTVAGAGLGGAAGYSESQGDPNAALAGAVLGGATGFLSYKGLEAMLRPNSRIKIQGKVTDLKNIKSETKSAIDFMKQPAKDIAGQDVRQQGGIMSKFVKGIEYWGRLHLPEEVKTAWTQSRGMGAMAVNNTIKSLQALKGFKPTQAIQDMATKFIEGKFLPEAEAARIISQGGGITEQAWKALGVKPSGYTKWNGNYVPEPIKAKLINAETDAFKAALGNSNALYFDFINTSRRTLDVLQHGYSEGLTGDLKDLVKDSTGQYVTRTYQIFNDPQYKPTAAQIENAMGELGAHLGSKGMDFNEDYLRNEIERYLQDLKSNKQSLGFIGGKYSMDSTLLKEREELSPTFRELLGEYTDPKERILQSIARLYPSAQASRFISLAADMDIDGLKASLTRDEWVTKSKQLHEQIDNLKARGANTQASVLETQLRRLNEYVAIPENLKFGKFSDVLANRFVADQLKGFDPSLEFLNAPLFRGIARVNNWSKIVHTAYDPIRVMRNIITVPMFKSIGRASWKSMGQALDALKTKEGPIYRELLEQGILGADQVSSEFRGSLEELFNGKYDSTFTSKLKAGHNVLLDFYRMPDAITRAGVYLEAKSRYSAELKLPIDHPEVMRKAVEWTDRRTINYENIAPAVKLARQIPFFNLYVSYASEIARITKNLAVDAAHGDIRSIAQLGVLAGGFEAVQAAAEVNLNDKDRTDWKRANAQGADYSRSRYKIPIGRDSKGNFSYVDITPLIITDSFNQTLRSAFKGDFKGAVAVNPFVGWENSPVFNVINQFSTGLDTHTQRELKGFQDYAGVIAKELSPTWTPGIGYEWQRISSIGQENTRTGRTENWPGTLTRFLTGLNVTSVNPTSTERSAVAKLKQHVAEERSYLNDTLKMSGISSEKKQRAVNVYQQAVQAAIADYITTRNK